MEKAWLLYAIVIECAMECVPAIAAASTVGYAWRGKTWIEFTP